MNAQNRNSHFGVEPLVYLLDPDPSVLAALTQLLSEAGIKASPCTHAAAFFARYEPERIGCLVLDMVLQRQLAQSGGADDAKAFVATMRKSMQVTVAEDRL